MDKGEKGGGKRGHGRQDGHGSDEDVLEVHLGGITSAPDLESEWIEVSKTTLTTTLTKEPSNNPAPDHVVSFPANFLLLSPRPHPILSGPKNLSTSLSSNSSFPFLPLVDTPINPNSTTIPLITMVSPSISARSTNSNSNLSDFPNANTNAGEVLLEIFPNRNSHLPQPQLGQSTQASRSEPPEPNILSKESWTPKVPVQCPAKRAFTGIGYSNQFQQTQRQNQFGTWSVPTQSSRIVPPSLPSSTK